MQTSDWKLVTGVVEVQLKLWKPSYISGGSQIKLWNQSIKEWEVQLK